jgi:hypothetical protein
MKINISSETKKKYFMDDKLSILSVIVWFPYDHFYYIYNTVNCTFPYDQTIISYNCKTILTPAYRLLPRMVTPLPVLCF